MAEHTDELRSDAGTRLILPPGMPRKGWIYEGCTDLKSLSGSCEACGTAIRYVHTLSHPAEDLMIEVGCVCAEHLCEDYVTPARQERLVKGFAARLATFSKKAWYVNERGTHWLRYHGHLLWVFKRKDGSWGYAVDQQFSTKRFKTVLGARQAAYQQMYGPKKP